ncbi:hypothetical protein NC796_07085 [Aliifodinibius sp. S!AR15-10]|uniref:hypothetical protein n=1 Tax=Aliifodinibius sp. S!AR15-10 TaxID=2950437 RepID=UPI00285D181E|nr:hypothetical protein [Aliifodinibius sp. S!AR15-10]MDR8390894.1 hypothetical protein [Aliifodinibius sp. S!AR15-10]
MMKSNQINHIKVQTNEIPDELSRTDINSTRRSIALYYRGGKFIYQNFFTQPLIGKINALEGLEKKADVFFRSIRMVGSNTFHIRLVGKEEDVRKMCKDQACYRLLQGIGESLNTEARTRTYLEVSDKHDHCDVLISLDKKAFYLANNVKVEGKEMRIRNPIVVGDRMVGLTEKREVCIGQLTPDVIEKPNIKLDMELMDEINRMGKVDLLEPAPNSEDLFLVSIKNSVYQFNIWGEMAHFEELGEEVKHINSINFNHTSSIMATDNGLYEVDVKEMPNMIKAEGLPRRISSKDLSGEFQVALYTEDPYVCGINPALGVFSKTKDNKVMFF